MLAKVVHLTSQASAIPSIQFNTRKFVFNYFSYVRVCVVGWQQRK